MDGGLGAGARHGRVLLLRHSGDDADRKEAGPALVMTSSTIKVDFRGRLGRFALNAQFEVPARGVTALFGPSGCGKTATMRCIAGLNRLDGFCAMAGDVWQ